MTIKSRWTIDIPKCSLITYFFGSPNDPLSTTRRCFLDANDPDNRHFTRAEFRLWCQRLGMGLQRSKHFNKGDRILLCSANNIFFPVVFMGVICGGGIFTGTNPGNTARELAYQIKDSGATYVFCADAQLETAMEAAKSIEFPKERVFVFNDKNFGDVFVGPMEGCQHWSSLLAQADEAKSFAWDELSGDAANTTLALNYSSGTTGLPKGVEISHFNYVANVAQVNFMSQLNPNYEINNLKETRLCYLPMYHAMAQAGMICVSWKREIPVYILPKFDLLTVLEYIQRYRITNFVMVPPVAVLLTKHPDVKKFDLSSVTAMGSGAAPLPRDTAVSIEKRFPGINFKQGYGMTELTCSAIVWDPRQACTNGSTGELLPNTEAMLVAEDGSGEVAGFGPDQRGDLWIRGPQVMKGYWKKPEATKDTLTEDGWLKTGDVAYVDETGKFYMVDRKKELIKVKGNQVAPAELEGLLLEHPAVKDAAVIGVPTKDGDEAPRAYVVLQPGEQATQQDIMAFVSKNAARHKWLTAGVEWIEEIPKSATGKILRRMLKELAAKEEQQLKAKL